MVTVVALLAAPSGMVRRHAAEALRGSVDARAISALATATSDDEREVRVVAIGELGRLGAREALPELERALGQRRRGDRSRGGARARDSSAIGARSSRSSARSGAASGACGARPPMRSRASPTPARRNRCLRAVRTAAPDRRATAIVALGGVVRHRPDSTARELLLGYAEGNDAAAALAALDALGAMGDGAAVPRLRSHRRVALRR